MAIFTAIAGLVQGALLAFSGLSLGAASSDFVLTEEADDDEDRDEETSE